MPRLVLLVAAFVALAGCNGPEVRGSGIRATESRTATGEFDRIELSGALTARITVGEGPSVEVTGDDNIVPLVITEVRGRTLHVRMKSNTSVEIRVPLIVTITTPDLTAISASGAVDVDAKGVAASTFGLNVSGACELAVAGTTEHLTLDVSGATDVDTSGLAADDITLDISGACEARVHARTSISGGISGACDLTYTGGASTINVSSSGACDIRAAD